MWMEALESRLFLAATPTLHVVITNNAAPGPGLESFTVHFQADTSSDELGAFDGSFTGAMNQVLAGGLSTPSMDTAPNLSPTDLGLDTHLLLDTTQYTAANPPKEDRASDTGLGTYLAGGASKNMSLGLFGNARTTDLLFAQIVIPVGGSVHLVGTAVTDSSVSVPIDMTIHNGALDPTMTLNATPITMNEGDAAVALASQAVLTEPNFAPAGATLNFSLGAADAGDQFQIPNQGMAAGLVGVSGSVVSYGGTTVGTFAGGVNGTVLTITFNASSDSAAIQAVLRSVTFVNTSSAPPLTTRNVSVVYTGPTGAASGTVSVTLTAINDPPVVTVPGPLSGDKNAPVVFSNALGMAIGVTDPDVGTGTMRVILDATNGTLSLATTVNVTIIEGSATNSSHIAFISTLATVSAALDGLIFTPTLNYVGDANVSIVVSDMGNTGSGGPKTASGSVTVTLVSANSPPTAGNLTQNVDLSKATQLGLPIGDAETAVASLVVNIVPGQGPTKGTLENLGGGLWQYTPSSNQVTGSDSFTYTVSDDGVGGPGGVKTSADATVTLTFLGRTVQLDAHGKGTYLDSNGKWIAVSLTGGGAGTLYFDSAEWSNLVNIELDGTTTRSVLNFTPAVRNTYTTVGDIVVNGPISKIIGTWCDLHGAIVSIGSTTTTAASTLVFHDVTNSSITSAMPLASLSVQGWQSADGTDLVTAPRIDRLAGKGSFGANLELSGKLGTATIGGDLSGVNWDIAGGLTKITVTGTTDASVINIGQATGTKTAALTFHDVTNSSITSLEPLASLSVTDWQNLDGTDLIQAPRLDRLSSTSKVLGFGADLSLSGKLGTGTIGGNLSGVNWDIAGGIKAITVTGTADNCVIRSGLSIASLTFGAVNHTDVLAGIRPAVGLETLRHAAVFTDFSADTFANIGRLTVKGWTVNGKPPQTTTVPFFVDSNFSAASIGTASILNADFASVTDGLWVRNTITPKPVRSVSYKYAGGKWTYTMGGDSHGFVHLIDVQP